MGFSSHERERVKELVGETCWDDTLNDFVGREAVGRLRLFDSVAVSLSIVSEIKSETVRGGLFEIECGALRLRLILLFCVAVSEPVGVFEQVRDAMFDSLFRVTVTEIARVAESSCENVALLFVRVCETLPLVPVRLADADASCLEGERVDECGADSVAVAALVDRSLTTPSALYGISQMSLPSNTPPAKVLRPRLT